MIRLGSGPSRKPDLFPGGSPYSSAMNGLSAALGLFGMVLLAGLAVVFIALFAISMRRGARRKHRPDRPPTEITDAWAEAGRRGGKGEGTGGR